MPCPKISKTFSPIFSYAISKTPELLWNLIVGQKYEQQLRISNYLWGYKNILGDVAVISEELRVSGWLVECTYH
jgi:hypothetical protein